jgi:hypothetical protein
MWTLDSHSPSNHVLAAMSFIGDERLVRLYLKNHELDLRINYVLGGPMQCAASQGHLQIVKLLIDAHGDIETLLPDKKDIKNGWMKNAFYPSVSGPVMEAIYAAAYGGHEDILRLLAGLLYLREESRSLPSLRIIFYRFAVMGGHDVILDELARQSMVPIVLNEDPPGDRPLLNWRIFGWHRHGPGRTLAHLTLYGGKPGYKRAVELAPALDCDTSHKFCPEKDEILGAGLFAASRYGHGEVVTFLLKEGAARNAVHMEKAIIIASQRGFKSVVQSLLAHPLDDHNLDRVRLLKSSFQAAAEHGQVHIIGIERGHRLRSEAVSDFCRGREWILVCRTNY